MISNIKMQLAVESTHRAAVRAIVASYRRTRRIADVAVDFGVTVRTIERAMRDYADLASAIAAVRASQK